MVCNSTSQLRICSTPQIWTNTTQWVSHWFALTIRQAVSRVKMWWRAVSSAPIKCPSTGLSCWIRLAVCTSSRAQGGRSANKSKLKCSWSRSTAWLWLLTLLLPGLLLMNRPLARSTKSVKHSRQSFSTLTTTRRSSTCPKSWVPNLPARAQRHKYKWPRANTWSAHIKVNSAFVLYKNPWTSTELSTSTRSIKLVMRLMWSQYLTRMKTKTTSSSSA